MSDEKPYGDTYYAESARLHEEQARAAQLFTSQTLYMKHEMYMRDDAVRQRKADEAEAEWLRLDAEISALNSAEYAKKQAADRAAS